MEIAFLAVRSLLVAALYAFVGGALWLIWKDLRRQARQMDVPGLPALSLLRAGGPEAGSPREAYRFTRAEVILGRERGCDCRLADKTISARHARLTYHHGQWWVEDLGSKNGTFLNQERVGQAVVLAAGDELRCGQVVLKVEIEGCTPGAVTESAHNADERASHDQ